jgi:hypothetical protein
MPSRARATVPLRGREHRGRSRTLDGRWRLRPLSARCLRGFRIRTAVRRRAPLAERSCALRQWRWRRRREIAGRSRPSCCLRARMRVGRRSAARRASGGGTGGRRREQRAHASKAAASDDDGARVVFVRDTENRSPCAVEVPRSHHRACHGPGLAGDLASLIARRPGLRQRSPQRHATRFPCPRSSRHHAAPERTARGSARCASLTTRRALPLGHDSRTAEAGRLLCGSPVRQKSVASPGHECSAHPDWQLSVAPRHPCAANR